jgi:F420-dependent oxidoreductase-like protein
MKLGIQIPSFTFPGGPQRLGADLARIATAADEGGFDVISVMDHFFQIEMVGPAEDPMLEGYSALAFAAAVTDTIKLGTMVTGVTYRHPGVLVKTVTTLDVLSGGRAYLGIGAAWNEQEHRGLGVPYPPLAERFERLEETLQVARQMWAGDESAFHGAHHQLERPLSSPQPVSTPHPPILIGGTGEKKTLRFVARYGDACNIFEMGTEGVAHKLDVLQQHCAAEGRDYAEIERTTLGTLSLSADGREGTMTVGQAVDRFGAYAAIGVDQAVVSLADVHDPVAFELVPELVAQLAAITPAGR